MTTQRGQKKTTGNLTAILTFSLGLLLLAAWLIDGVNGGDLGILGIVGLVAVILGMYFNGKKPRRADDK